MMKASSPPSRKANRSTAVSLQLCLSSGRKPDGSEDVLLSNRTV
ncbi:hypothetical protein [Paenibacillus chitinolyticus]|nr:hypothetical protein [Paenibacillus chitinolyticus]